MLAGTNKMGNAGQWFVLEAQGQELNKPKKGFTESFHSNCDQSTLAFINGLPMMPVVVVDNTHIIVIKRGNVKTYQ